MIFLTLAEKKITGANLLQVKSLRQKQAGPSGVVIKKNYLVLDYTLAYPTYLTHAIDRLWCNTLYKE